MREREREREGGRRRKYAYIHMLITKMLTKIITHTRTILFHTTNTFM